MFERDFAKSIRGGFDIEVYNWLQETRELYIKISDKLIYQTNQDDDTFIALHKLEESFAYALRGAEKNQEARDRK